MFLKFLFLSFILATHLINCDPVKGLEIISNNWNNILYDWPNIDTVDQARNKSTEFYYINEIKSPLYWKIDQDFIKLLNDKQTVKLSFKFWTSSSPDNPVWHTPVIKFNSLQYSLLDNYRKLYINNAEKFWMPFEIILSKEQLNNFEFNFLAYNETAISAIKDLKVEYETETTITKGEYDDNKFEFKADKPKINFKFPTSCYFNNETFDQLCVDKYNFNLTAGTFTGISQINQCIRIKIFTLVEAEIKIKMNGQNDKTQNEIFKFKPLIVLDEQNYQDKMFCLSDYSTLTHGKVILTFEVIFKQPLKYTNYFGISINNEGLGKQQTEPLYLLSQMKDDIDSEHKWIDEWNINPPFEAQKDRIDFSGNTYYEEISTEVLLSKWIEFEPENFMTDARIKINVSDPKTFDSFRLMPQICDEMFHCIDTFVTKLGKSTDEKEMTIDFNFDPNIDGNKIKLKFLVEYYKPSFLINAAFTSNKFSIKLINFGDPCFGNNICGKNGSCLTDNNGSTKCSCDYGFFGEKCEGNDYCLSIGTYNNKTVSGVTYCGDKDCINMNKYNQKFRCTCDASKPNWNSETLQCEEMKISNAKYWTQDIPTKLSLYPNGSQNQFELKFFVNDDKKFCLKFGYTSTVNSILQVTYKNSDGNQDSPFQYFLVAATDVSIDVCTSDFRFTIEESFSLIFKISKITSIKYSKALFNINSIGKTVDIKDTTPITLIERWEKKDPEVFLNKHFDILDKIFKKDRMSFDITASKTEFTFSRLMSKWIKADKEFSNNLDNYFTITFKDKNMAGNVLIEGKILYHINEKTVMSNLKSTIGQTSNEEKTKTYKFEQLPENTGNFRIIIEFTFSPSDTQQTTGFSIDKFSFGDPCFTDFGTKGACQGQNIDVSNSCSRLTPNSPLKKKCNCKDSNKNAGPNCEYENLCTPDAQIICNNYTIGFNPTCISVSNKGYKCACSETFFTWDFANKRCLRNKKYQMITPVICRGKICKFMSDILKNATWANKNLPQIDRKTSSKPIPFFYTQEKLNTISFESKNKSNNEFCLTMKSKSEGNSSLSVFYDGNSAIQLPKVSDPRICVSDLAEPIAKKLKINLKQNQISDTDISIVQFDSSDIIATNVKLNLLNGLPYLVHWDIFSDLEEYKPESQWSLGIPKEEWDINSGSDGMIFTAKHTGKQQSYIFSHWIAPSKEEIMFRSKFTNLTDLNFTITFFIADNKLSMQQIKSTFNSELGNKEKTSAFLQTTIPKQSTNFRFVIRIDYNLDKIIGPPKLFKLENIDIGDPCIKNGYTINDCHGRGHCLRDQKEINGYKCKCDADNKGKTYTGQDCQIEDYCNTPDPKNDNKKGNDICPGSCQNIENMGYKCNCSDKSTYWDFDKNKCEPFPKCLANSPACKQFEKCSDENGNATCVCINDYVRNEKTKLCELYNPCNTDHVKDDKDKQLCSEVDNSFCQPRSFGDKADWDCECNFGYEKSGSPRGATKCLSVICNYPSLNKCQQLCQPQPTNDTKTDQYKCSCNKNYILDNNKYNCKFNESVKVNCDKKCESLDKYCDTDSGQCKCRQGFDQIGDNCNQKIDRLFCPTGNLSKEVNGKQYCDCGDDYHFNSTTLNCELSPICGDGGRGRKECDLQGKLCILDPTEAKKFKCHCKFDLKEQKGICVENCDIIDKGESETRSNKCKKRNAICNRNLINPTDVEIKNETFCECASGFVKNKDKNCVVSEFSSKISLLFKDEFSFCGPTEIEQKIGMSSNPVIDKTLQGNALKKFILDSISMNKLNNKLMEKNIQDLRLQCLTNKIGKIIVDYYIDNTLCKSFNISKCTKEQKSDYITCTFTAIFSNEKQTENTKFLDKLKASCYDYDKQNCFIEPKSTTSYYNNLPQAIPLGRIIMDSIALQKANLIPIKGCDGDPCLGNSNCVPDKNSKSSLYSCICNPKFFSVKSSKILETDSGPNKEYVIEECNGNNVCPTICLNEGNTCIQDPRRDSLDNKNWTMVYACTCNGLKFRNNATSCTNVCDKVDCNKNNAESKIIDGTCQCVCKEGYYGTGCDSEHSISKGGWIAGIVVLAVLVVILAGVAFMFARRSRNNSTEYSGRPMDDYTGSSYRVPPNQSRGQQNPSFTRE